MTVQEIKKEFPEGTQIVLNEMYEEPQMPYGLKGIVSSVDDIGQIHVNWENGSSLALNVDVDSFEKIESKEKISVVLVEPGKCSKVVSIDNALEIMQKIVGGDIEQYMPFDDEVAIICNEEGKLNGLLLNRAIYSKENKIIDIVAGSFFVAYAPAESSKFQSMPKELAYKYEAKFKFPERFYNTGIGIVAEKYNPASDFSD